MKLRSLICVSAVAAASAALALDGANTFARLKVNSNFKDSIIAIPLAGCGESDAKIYVTNLVMTAGLADGDTLMYNNGTAWYAWEIQGASGGNAHWVGVNTSDKTAQNLATPAEEFAVDCGKACWLLRSNAEACYLYGQVITNATLPSVNIAGVASGSNDQVAYTIVGYPSEAASLNLKIWHPAGIAAGDTLLVPSATATGGRIEYRSNGSAWCKFVKVAKEGKTDLFGNPQYTTVLKPVSELEDEASIAPGCGFMYGRKGESGFTLNW